MLVAEPRSFPFVAMGTCCELRLYGDEATTTGAAGATIAEVRRHWRFVYEREERPRAAARRSSR